MDRSLYLPRISLIAPNLDAPWVTIQAVNGAGLAWRCVLIHHLTPFENGNNHHVYVDCLGPSGQPVADPSKLRLGWTWVGKRPDEQAPDKVFDKRAPEPACNLDLYKGQYASIWIKDVYASDIVSNLRTDLGGGDLFHNSLYVVFQITGVALPPLPPMPRTLEERMALVEARLTAVNAALHLWTE